MVRLNRIPHPRLVAGLVVLALAGMSWLVFGPRTVAPKPASLFSTSSLDFPVARAAHGWPKWLALPNGRSQPGALRGGRLIPAAFPSSYGPETYAPSVQPSPPSTTPLALSPFLDPADLGLGSPIPRSSVRPVAQPPVTPVGAVQQAAAPRPFLPVTAAPTTFTAAPTSRSPWVAATPAPVVGSQVIAPPAAATSAGSASPSQPARSEALEKVARQADRQVMHGYDLANRGAYFAARAEFTGALRLIAQGLDVEEHSTRHSAALGAGITAIRESQDFVPSGARLEADLDLVTIVGSHKTPILKGAAAEELRPLSAVKRYLTFAQDQLAAAARNEVAGSMALCALGKLHAALARQKSIEMQAAEPKAIVYLQAAILVYPRNFIAANDLGVLYAHAGDYAAARQYFEHTVLLNRNATSLSNLATVYQQLGERQLAGLAMQKANYFRQTENSRMLATQGSTSGTVQWVTPEVMAQTGGQGSAPPPNQAVAPATAACTPTVMNVKSNR